MRAIAEQMARLAGPDSASADEMPTTAQNFIDLAEAGIRVVTTRHEGAAAFMAEALSQSTGRPQIVAVSRAVGAANARNPIAIIVPCHRVVGADGTLTGYGGGLDVKRRLLSLEGVELVAFVDTAAAESRTRAPV